MLLHAQALACRRGGRLLFQGIDLTVDAGQLVWVRGPNGRGKSSLLRLLAGLSRPDSGVVTRTAPMVYIGHQHALKDDLSAQEALSFLVALHEGQVDVGAVASALEQMGVKGRRHALVRMLSQGQRRRVSLARLLLSKRGSVWILDEPLDSLDDQGLALVSQLIVDHRLAGGAVIMTSHQAVNLDPLMTLDLQPPDREAAACGR
jgi:heme exporter protein A